MKRIALVRKPLGRFVSGSSSVTGTTFNQNYKCDRNALIRIVLLSRLKRTCNMVALALISFISFMLKISTGRKETVF